MCGCVNASQLDRSHCPGKASPPGGVYKPLSERGEHNTLPVTAGPSPEKTWGVIGECCANFGRRFKPCESKVNACECVRGKNSTTPDNDIKMNL